MARLQRGAKSIIEPLKDQIEGRARRAPRTEEPEHFNPDNFVSSGSTLLNLALTDHPDCGWRKGRMANIIGDSSAGKTFFCLTSYAEAELDPSFDKYDFIFDDAEHANDFDMKKLFGKAVAKRVHNPDNGKGEFTPSDKIEDFSDNLLRLINSKVPFFYTLDSFDALTCEADSDKMEEHRIAREKGNQTKGTYGMGKAKGASGILREVCGKIENSGSVLLIISQTRDNVDPMSPSKRTRSGGRALKFYAAHEVWLYLGKPIKSRDRIIGTEVEINVSKNKITGKRRSVTVSIFYDYGIDDIGSMIDFLLDEKEWTGGGKSAIDTKGFVKESMSRNKLIEHIEQNELEKKLQALASKVWNDIEDSLKLNRKSKYN